MALKGTKAKTEILNKIMEIYPNAFIHEKVLRIPIEEDNETVEIKVTLTAAKDCITPSKTLSFTSDPLNSAIQTPLSQVDGKRKEDIAKMTEEEENNIKELAAALQHFV